MARHGKPPTKNCPAWLAVAGVGKDRHYIEIEDRVKLVRDIFTMAAAGMSELAIIKKLNADGNLNFREPPTAWQAGQIDHIVTSKAPMGIVVSKAIEFEHYPQIVDPTTWRAAQQARKANRNTKQNWGEAERKNSLPTVRNLFPGLLYCAHCRSKMAFNASAARKGAAPRLRLYCAKAMNRSGCAAKVGLNYPPLERAILSRLEYADRNGLLNTNPSEEIRVADLKIDQIKIAIATAEKEWNNLANMYKQNPYPRLMEKMDKQNAEINALEAELKVAEISRPAHNLEDHKKALAELREAAEAGDYESRVRVRLALNALVDRIECNVISGLSSISVARKAYSFMCDADGNTYDFSSAIKKFGEEKVDPIFLTQDLPSDVTPAQAAFLSRLVTMFAAVKPPDAGKDD